MLQKTRSKKGFTLAELLIVVAIIAVLTAIAVPLFVGALSNADKKVQAANEAAVKEMAISEILLADGSAEQSTETRKIYDLTHNADGTLKTDKFKATADVSAKGDVTNLTIYGTDGTPTYSASKKNGDAWQIFVEFSITDAAKAGAAGGA